MVNDVKVEGRTFGTVSGMAPGREDRRLQGLCEHTDPTSTAATTPTSLAAINHAVADGVDVINFSISGGARPILDAIELAFKDAAEAGIFVSASAGNAARCLHPSPTTARG